MERIRINQSEQAYEIESIQPISVHILQVVFADAIPEEFGDIQVYTAGGIQCANLPGYDTIYRAEGKTVCLSDDSSVYTPPAEPEPVIPPEPYMPTLEERQAAKKAEVAADCEQIIYKGVNVTLSDGTVEHYSLTEHDQLNLVGKQAQLAAGAEQLEYHADGQPCCYYSAADMQAIIQAAMWHVSYHTTYCNAINMWIAGCQNAETVREIFYGADVPAEYRSEVLNAYLLQIAAMAEDREDETIS